MSDTHTHVVPFDEVELKGFIKIVHSSTSDVYIALSEISLVCNPHAILSLNLRFPTLHFLYGIAYTTRQKIKTPPSWLSIITGDMLHVLHFLIKDLQDGVNLYLFEYQDKTSQVIELPRGCPEPPEVEGHKPKLIAVIRKT